MKKISYYNNKNIISQKLKELREKKGLSQSNLAAKLQIMNVNIDQQMISKIEKIIVRLQIMSWHVYANACQ